MRHRVLPSLGLPLALLSGCVLRAGRFPERESVSGAGASISIVSGAKQVHGELLEVRDSAVVVLTGQALVLAPFPNFDSGFVDAGVYSITFDPRTITPKQREDIRLVSRYPPGIPAAALPKLLASRKQTEVEVLGR